MQAHAAGFPDKKTNPKWRALHASQWQQQAGKVAAGCSANDLFLHLPRERDAWSLLSTSHSDPDLVADLSQSVTRAGVRTDGKLPTITPGSVLAVRKAGRTVSPLEKIMLHGFPVHRMSFPHHISQKDLEVMGGNTMHVHVVGAAMLMALAMVDWSLPAVARPCGELPMKPTPKRSKVQGPRSKVRSPSSQVPGRRSSKRPVSSVLTNLAARWQLPKSKPVVIKKQKSSASKRSCSTRMPALRGTLWES